MNKPDKIVIMGITYTVTYMDKPSDVDIFKRESLWGQIDYWTRTIRVYDVNLSPQDILHSVLHETVHGIAQALHLTALCKEENHEELDLLSLALVDVEVRKDRKSTRLNSSHIQKSRMPSSA